MGDAAKAMRLIGLGARSRGIVVGVEQARAAVLADRAHLVIVAADASRHGRDKIVPLVQRRGITMIETASAAALGAAVGHTTTTVVAVLDPALARGVAEAMGSKGDRVE